MKVAPNSADNNGKGTDMSEGEGEMNEAATSSSPPQDTGKNGGEEVGDVALGQEQIKYGFGSPLTHVSSEPFWFSRQIYERPYVVACTVFFLAILLSFAAMSVETELDTTGETLVIEDSTTARQARAFQLAAADVTRPPLDADVVQDAQVELLGFASVYFLAKEGESGNVFKRSSLAAIQELEAAILQLDDYPEYCLRAPTGDCVPPFSSLSGLFGVGPDDDLPDQATIDVILANVATALEANHLDPRGYYVSNTFSTDDPTSFVTRHEYLVGSPLDGYNNADVDPDGQEQVAADWIVDKIMPLLDDFSNDEVEVLYFGTGLTQAIFDKLLLRDASLSIGAFGFVFLYIWFHTKAFMLTFLGMIHILLALPTAFFFYRVVIGIKFFSVLTLLGFFILLGVGADDIFVFLDAWKQSRGYISGAHDERRLAWAYRRSVGAMFWTSLTTGVAFLANAVSIIPGIADFGVFMFLLVVCNYILVITLFPAVVIIWHRWFGRKQEQKQMETEMEAVNASAAELGVDPGNANAALHANFRPLEKFFHFTVTRVLSQYNKLVLAFFFVFVVIFFSFAVQIEPDDKPTQFVPDDFPIIRYVDARDESFLQVSKTTLEDTIESVVEIHFVWGIKEPYVKDGRAVFDESFNLVDPAAQEELYAVCLGAAEEEEYVLEGGVRCFVEELKNFVEAQGGVFPVEDADDFANYTLTLVEKNPLLTEENLVGVIAEPFSVPFASQLVFSTLNPRDSAPVSREHFDFWTDFLERGDAPESAGTPYHTAVRWEDMETEEVLLRTAMFGFFLSMILSFMVILVSSRNWILSCLAIVTIIGISSSILGSMVMMGWKLGIIESVIMTAIVGLAVDYTVHIANSYNESVFDTRYERTQHALTEMGISVMSAAVTTVGSALFLTGTIVIFFVKFGIFLAFTVFYSATFGFGLLPALMFAFGPEHDKGKVTMPAFMKKIIPTSNKN